MAQQIINVGTNPNDGTGDTLRGAFVKTDNNFTDLYTNKQNTLISGTNIKTVNSTSLLGSGNVSVQPTLVSGTNIKTINGNSLLGSGDLAISGGITGSGTDNYIPRFNGTTALENSIIFDDGTNVGIGTASPISKFNLVGGAASFDFGGFANIPAIKLLASGDEPTLRFYRPSGTTPNARIFQIQNTVGDLTFGYALANKYSESSFTEAMRITSIGSVGIGTTSPLAKLNVVGTSAFISDFAFVEVTNEAIYMGGKNSSGMALEDGLSSFGHNPGGDFRGVRANYDQGVWFTNESGNKLGLEPIDNELFVEGMIQTSSVPSNILTPNSWIKVYNYDDSTTYFLPVYL